MQRRLRTGYFEKIVENVQSLLRHFGVRKGQPTAVTIDSRTLQSTPVSGARAEQAREAVQAFRANEPGKATDILQEQGRVYEYANPDSRLAAVAIDYAARPDCTVIVAPDAADRQGLTQLIRADLQAQGRIAEESRSVPVLVEQDF